MRIHFKAAIVLDFKSPALHYTTTTTQTKAIFSNMSSAKNTAVPSQSSKEAILQAHNAVMAVLEQIKADLAAVRPMELADPAKDKVARDERWKVTIKIASTLVRRICLVHIDFLY